MSGGERYWNEDHQRWEERAGEGAGSVTPPTPPVNEWATVGSWAPKVPAPAPATVGGMDRRLVWSVVVGAAVVGVAVSLVLTLVVGKGDGGSDDKAVAGSSVGSPSPSEWSAAGVTPGEGTVSPSVSVSVSPSVFGPPAGYEKYDDAEGFQIAVPEGWTRGTVDSEFGIAVVNYRSADRTHRLQVYQVAEDSPAASFELFLSDRTSKAAGFRKLDLQTLDDGQFTGSRLEYLADTIKGEPDVGTWHVYDERFVAADGNIYAIASYGPDSDGRADELARLATALTWFCPPYTSCGTDAGLD